MPAFITAGASLLGGLFQGSSNRSAASTEAAGNVEAARLAADEAKFRPVGVTTRFGSSQFQTGPDGRVTGADYTLDPAFRAYQDRLMRLAGGGLTQAEGAQARFAPLGSASESLFNLGGKYLAESPEQAAEKYILGRQNLLAPSRERQLAGLRTNLFNTGRQGLSVGGTGVRPGGGAGLGASNPELEAYYNSIAQEDARLAAEGMQGGMDQTRFGAGLFSTGGNLATQGYNLETAALGPYEAYLQQMKQLEALGQDPLNIGINIGAKGQSTAGAQAMLSTAPTRESYAANAYNPFAEFLMAASRNPRLQGGVQPYASAAGQSAIYGNQNVYGYGGGGTVPSQISLFGEY